MKSAPSLAELLRVPQVDNTLPFDISRDESRVVYSSNRSGSWKLFERKLNGNGSDSAAIPVSLRGACFSPKYSPDGTMIAFAVDADGSESYHICISDLGTSKETDLTPQSAYAHQPNFAWAPDSRSLAVLSNERGQFALYLVSVESGQRRLLLDVTRPLWDARWSPDGAWIAVEAEWVGSDRRIFIVNAQSGTARRLTLRDKILNAQHPSWSPDSKSLAFAALTEEWLNIGKFDLASGQIAWTSDSRGDDSQPFWSADGTCLGWLHADGAATSIQLKSGSGPLQELSVGPGVHSFPHLGARGIVVVYEDCTRPPDLWHIDIETETCKQITRSLPPPLEAFELAEPQEIAYESRDGAHVPALLYRAKESRGAIVNIHGGPNWYMQNIWEPITSYFAANGFTVLWPNYRGSTGYGARWQSASRFDMGGVDADDCSAAAKYLRDNALAPADKLAVTGRSHGGFLTMACLTRNPELWAAGSAIVPFMNWIKSHGESREDLQHWNTENMGDPIEQRARWHDLSPYFFLERVQAPVQLICGANDPRCPASDSIDAAARLKALGKQVQLHVYEGEGHTFRKIENVIDAEQRRADFLQAALTTTKESIR